MMLLPSHILASTYFCPIATLGHARATIERLQEGGGEGVGEEGVEEGEKKK